MCFDKTVMARWTLIILQKHVWFSMSNFLSNMHVIFQEMWPHKNCVIIESFSCTCRLLITESNNLSGYFSKVQISMVVKVLQFNRLIFFFSRENALVMNLHPVSSFHQRAGLACPSHQTKLQMNAWKIPLHFFSSRLLENVIRIKDL